MKIVIPLRSIEEYKEIEAVLLELSKLSECFKIAIAPREDCDKLKKVTDIYTRIEVSKSENGVQESRNWGIELFCLSQEIEDIEPDRILILGTGRHMFSAAVVGAHLNIVVFRIENGNAEIPTEKMYRDSGIKFSHFHIVKEKAQKDRMLRLGEDNNRIIITGDPKDIAKIILTESPNIQKILAY